MQKLRQGLNINLKRLHLRLIPRLQHRWKNKVPERGTFKLKIKNWTAVEKVEKEMEKEDSLYVYDDQFHDHLGTVDDEGKRQGFPKNQPAISITRGLE